MRATGLMMAALTALGLLAGCESAPRQMFIEWTMRDFWDPGCADQAAIEKVAISDKRWKEKGKIYTFDADVTLKLVNPCTSTTSGKTYEQFSTVPLKLDDAELHACKADGHKGWKAGADGRCWTGPNAPKLD